MTVEKKESDPIATVAEIMVERYGRDALARIEERAERYRADGDLDGAAYWRRVAWVVQDMKIR